MILGDYANADSAGKVNILGAGWQVAPLQPTGFTPPHALAALIAAPPRYYDQEFAVTITLRDEAGQPVQVPGPIGEPQTLRVQQILKAERPAAPGMLTMDKPWAQAKVMVNFLNGLPLQGSHLYTWDLEIEGTPNPAWAVSFFVAGPASPVIG